MKKFLLIPFLLLSNFLGAQVVVLHFNEMEQQTMLLGLMS